MTGAGQGGGHQTLWMGRAPCGGSWALKPQPSFSTKLRATHPFTTEDLLCTLLGTRNERRMGEPWSPPFWNWQLGGASCLPIPHCCLSPTWPHLNTDIITIHVYIVPCYHLSFLRIPWTARRSNQSILKEINPEYSLEGLTLKFQYSGHLMQRANSLEKTLMLGKMEGRRRRGRQRMRGLDGITDSME